MTLTVNTTNGLFLMALLGTLGTYAMSFGKDPRRVPEACTVLLELAEIATWYGLGSLVEKVDALLKKMRSEYYELAPKERRTK